MCFCKTLFAATIALTEGGKRTHSLAVLYISSDKYLKTDLKICMELEIEKHFFCSKLKKTTNKKKGGGE